MKKCSTILMSLFLLPTLVFATVQTELDLKQTEFKKASNKITQIEKALQMEQQQQLDFTQQLAIDAKQMTDLSPTLNTLNNQLSEKRTQIERIKNSTKTFATQLIKQQVFLADQQHLITDLQQSLQLHANDGPLLTQQLKLYQNVTEDLAKSINNIKQVITNLASNMTTLTIEEQSTRTALEQKQQQQAHLQQAQVIRQRALAELTAKTAQRESELLALNTNLSNLQSAIINLQNQAINLSISQPFTDLYGKLAWPLTGTIANIQASGGDQHLTGVMIHGSKGSQVHAISAGKVVYANWLRGFGLLVIINHGDGYMSLYGRNDTLYAKVGDNVHAGDVIAAIGDGGGQNTDSSLYFEIRHDGVPINPHKWCI